MSINEASSRPQETGTRWWPHLIETGMPIALFAVTFGIMMYAVSMMNGNDEGWNVRSQFLAAQLMLGILVFGILPLGARLRSRTTVDASELRGLNLPRGSIRAMLTLSQANSDAILALPHAGADLTESAPDGKTLLVTWFGIPASRFSPHCRNTGRIPISPTSPDRRRLMWQWTVPTAGTRLGFGALRCEPQWSGHERAQFAGPQLHGRCDCGGSSRSTARECLGG